MKEIEEIRKELERIKFIAGVKRPKGPCGQAEHNGFQIYDSCQKALKELNDLEDELDNQ